MQLGLTYVPCHLPDYIKRDMDVISSAGCNEVLFATQENHIKTLDGALRFGASLAKDAGLKPYAMLWGFANTFGGGRMSIFMLENLDVWRVGKSGEKAPLCCLNNPKVIDSFLEYTRTLWNHGFEGVYIDEPTPQDCFCDICRLKFREMFGGDLLLAEGTREYKKFQRHTIRAYTGDICKVVKNLDRKIKTFCCIMPEDSESFHDVANIPELDVFSTDPYWMVLNESIEWAVKIAKDGREAALLTGKEFHLWLNVWNIPAGRESEIYTGGKKLAEAGCDALYAWSYRASQGTFEECDNPKLAWEYYCKLSRELSQK